VVGHVSRLPAKDRCHLRPNGTRRLLYDSSEPCHPQDYDTRFSGTPAFQLPNCFILFAENKFRKVRLEKNSETCRARARVPEGDVEIEFTVATRPPLGPPGPPPPPTDRHPCRPDSLAREARAIKAVISRRGT
jgi:hypothetical protein